MQGGESPTVKETNYKGRQITVIGAGLSGQALAGLADRLGAEVFVTELGEVSTQARQLFCERKICFEEKGHTDRAWQADLVLASSGLSPTSAPVREAGKRNIPVMGELDFVAPFLKGKILAVTGSNGKTTTTSLIGHLLSECGFRVKTAGNIGSPIAEAAGMDLDYIAVELSSFQLHWVQNFPVDLALVTNLAPDHLDWHGSYEKYVSSKMHLLTQVKPGGQSVVQIRDLARIPDGCANVIPLIPGEEQGSVDAKASLVVSKNKALYLTENGEQQTLFTEQDMPLLGLHNMENGGMAFLACLLQGADQTTLRNALRTFKGLPHRCELVGTRNGVRYVDDSKGTNVAATVTALQSLPGEKIIILGGQGKGEDYSALAQAVKRHAVCAVLIGSDGPRIRESLIKANFSDFFEEGDMEQAVFRASKVAREGETVLLSPACTSWDMYPNYKERGRHFQELVRRLES